MMARLRLFAIAAMLALSACASRPPPELRIDGIPFLELPRQTLKPGTCSMFLWVRDGEAARRIMMITPDPTLARVKVRQRQFSFEATAESGTKVAGLSPQMSFAGLGVSFSLDLTLAQRTALTQGFLVESGTLTYTAANGWSATLPVAGVVACEPARR